MTTHLQPINSTDHATPANDKPSPRRAGQAAPPVRHHVDPAEAAMSTNPNISPPIVPNPN